MCLHFRYLLLQSHCNRRHCYREMLRALWGTTNNILNDNDDDRNAICNDQSSCDGEQESTDYSYLQEHCHFLLLSQKEVYFLNLISLMFFVLFNSKLLSLKTENVLETWEYADVHIMVIIIYIFVH